jgi:protein-S-isoprenylcysteine O-methyltransferase Ste14
VFGGERIGGQVAARSEERVLAEMFGEEYTTYRSKTWF